MRNEALPQKFDLVALASFLIVVGTLAFVFHAFKPLVLKWTFSDGRAERIASKVCAKVPQCEKASIDILYQPQLPGWGSRMTLHLRKPPKGAAPINLTSDTLQQEARQAMADAVSLEESRLFRWVFPDVDLQFVQGLTKPVIKSGKS